MKEKNRPLMLYANGTKNSSVVIDSYVLWIKHHILWEKLTRTLQASLSSDDKLLTTWNTGYLLTSFYLINLGGIFKAFTIIFQ